MLNWWRKWWQRQVAVESPQDSALYIARRHGLNRRQFARVVLPDASTGYFPGLKFQHKELPIVDISTGGACVRDPGDQLLPLLSQVVTLKWILPDHEEMVKVRVVGVSKHVNRHVQFLDLMPATFKLIESMVEVGCYGQKLKQASSLHHAPAQLHVIELWTGLQGDGLVFYESKDLTAELTFASKTMRFYPTAAPRVQTGSDFSRTRPAQNREIMEALTCLLNITPPSDRLINLIEQLNRKPGAWPSTGSGV